MHQAVYVKEAFTLFDKINKHLVKKLHTIVIEIRMIKNTR